MISPEDVIGVVCVYSRPAGCGFSCPYLADRSSSAPDAGAEASGCPAGTCRQTPRQKNEVACSPRSAGESSQAASLWFRPSAAERREVLSPVGGVRGQRGGVAENAIPRLRRVS